jgi:hypothetical protein
MRRGRVLVIGGTGFFGSLLIDDLLSYEDCDLVVASRHRLQSDRFETVIADLQNTDSLAKALATVDIAICAAGPYQQLPLSLLSLCVQRGIHYIDLTDDRGFVQSVRTSVAKQNDCSIAVCTGWSTVAALSGLLAKIASNGMRPVDSIHIQMAPGNRGARQRATITSLLNSVGRRFTVFRNGDWQTVQGWSQPRDFEFPVPVGKRRGYLVDVPDHEFFPDLFNSATVEFRAGSELRLLNGCTTLLRLAPWSWVPWSGVLQQAVALLSWLGHDWGAIGVEVSGGGRRRACIVADSRAERIAVMPASVMTGKLLSGGSYRGLVSYTDWLSEEQLRNECARRKFRLVLEDL